jgi:hypothetical protein
MPDKKPEFDFRRYELKQIIEAINCPVNRHATREEHKCDDWYLHENPHLLVIHFVEKGGAVEFAKRRAEFLSLCELSDDCEFKEDCDLCKMKTDYLKCPVRNRKIPREQTCPLGEIFDKS